MNFATQYNFRYRDTNFATVNQDPTMTQQSDRDTTNINVIVARFMKTGQMPQVKEQPRFGDFSEVTDYATALQLVRQADETFQQVPAAIRNKFNNDPAKFIAFVEDPANKDELIKMGLAKAPRPTQTTPVSQPTGVPNANTATTDTTGHRGQPDRPSSQGSSGLPEGGVHHSLPDGHPGGRETR